MNVLNEMQKINLLPLINVAWCRKLVKLRNVHASQMHAGKEKTAPFVLAGKHFHPRTCCFGAHFAPRDFSLLEQTLPVSTLDASGGLLFILLERLLCSHPKGSSQHLQ